MKASLMRCSPKQFLGFAAPHEAMPRARESVLRALELDDSVAEAHATFALILAVYDWDWAGAEREFRRSIALNESSPLPRDNYAFYYLVAGQNASPKLAFRRSRRWRSIPLAVLTRVHLGFLFYAEKQFEQAAAQFQKALEMDANHFLTNALLWDDAYLPSRFRARSRSPPPRPRSRSGQQVRGGFTARYDPRFCRSP